MVSVYPWSCHGFGGRFFFLPCSLHTECDIFLSGLVSCSVAKISASYRCTYQILFSSSSFIYLHIGQVLKKQNPFAYRAVCRGLEAHSLRLSQRGFAASWEFLNCSTAYSDWYLISEFTPLKIVLQHQNPPVKEEWLAKRYSLSYTDQTQIDTPLFTLFMERSPHKVADVITHSDVANFRKLGIQSIIDMNETFRGIGHEWKKLCIHIQEFTHYDKHLANKALKVAKVSWYNTFSYT